MTEWGVVGVIVALVGFLAATAGPLLKLNGAITRLTVAVEGFQKSGQREPQQPQGHL